MPQMEISIAKRKAAKPEQKEKRSSVLITTLSIFLKVKSAEQRRKRIKRRWPN
jgi:hypothetical protein